MSSASIKVAFVLCFLTAIVTCDTALGLDTTVRIDGLSAGDLKSETLVIDRNTPIHIEAVGAEWESSDRMFAYAWIIDAHTRNLIWSMNDEFTSPVKKSKWLRQYDDQVNLEQGTYELYFYAGNPMIIDGHLSLDKLSELFKSLGHWLDEQGKASNRGPTGPDLADKYFVSLTGDASLFRTTTTVPSPEPVVKLIHPQNDAYLRYGFTLGRDMDLEIYSIGEYSDASEQMADWGWIVDAQTRARVWEMTEQKTDWAGGADKNRRFRDRMRLKAGNYVAFYVTDDSHTYGDWNSSPPSDPDGWGLQIFAVNSADRAYVKPYSDTRDERPIVKMTGIGDNELRSEAFRVTKPVVLHIYAIGEFDRFGDHMADYGWIVRSGRSAKIWAMTGANTVPAGGAEKNRLFDGTVPFDSGDYVAYYASDGSHSYGGGWNASPPYDQKAYGLTISASDQSAAAASVVTIDQADLRSPDMLAQIAATGNNEDLTRKFSLSSPTRVRVHAVGEGTRGGMSDYGWIENEQTGDVVWEMTYRKTTHAGGAEKNRLVDQTILLDKGEYLLRYTTDGSHAPDDWNDSPPDDPRSWGITVSKVAVAETP